MQFRCFFVKPGRRSASRTILRKAWKVCSSGCALVSSLKSAFE